MFSMAMVRTMEKLPYFNYSFTRNTSCYDSTLFVDEDDVCPRCGKEGCKCDPETCDCEPIPKQKDLIQDLEKTSNKEGTREIDKSNKNLTHMSDALGYAVHWEKPIIKQTLGSIKR